MAQHEKKCGDIFFFEKHNTNTDNTDTHICMSTHLYEHTHILPL
jgi:hypothetical protein